MKDVWYDKSLHVHVYACEVDYVHPDLSAQERCQAHQRGCLTTINSITACIKGIVPPHRPPNRDVPLASTNNPGCGVMVCGVMVCGGIVYMMWSVV